MTGKELARANWILHEGTDDYQEGAFVTDNDEDLPCLYSRDKYSDDDSEGDSDDKNLPCLTSLNDNSDDDSDD